MTGVAVRTFGSLRTRNFRLFFIGQLISNSGNWLTNVAIVLLVLHQTGSGVAVGLLTACQYGPMLVVAPWAGLVADRSNKRHLLFVTQSLEMTESFVLALLAFLHVALPAFYITALAGGFMLAVDNPARRSFVNEMVQADDVSNAVTLYSAMVALSRIIGPTVAGVLVVGFGYGWCFTADGASYLIVLAALAMMRVAELRRTPVTPRGKGQVRAGLRYLMTVPDLWVSFLMLLVIGIASYNFPVVFPLFVELGLHGTDTQYTLVYAAFSVGGVVGTLGFAGRIRVSLRTVIVSAAALGAAMIALSAVPDAAVAYGVVVLVGATSVIYMTATTAIVQIESDRHMIGRVLALQTVLLLGTTPIGGPILGFVADVAGGRAPVLIGGIAAVGAAGLGSLTAWSGRRGRVRAAERSHDEP